jgi:hypothetical protein
VNLDRTIRRLARLLAAALAACLAWAAAPAALATPRPRPPGWNKHPPLPAHTHLAAAAGLPGWQVTLIIAATVLLTAALAVLATRMRATRQRLPARST